MQAAADKAIKKHVFATDNPVASRGPGPAGHRRDQGDGGQPEVRHAKKKNEMSLNVVADVAHGGGTGFQAGSTFKMFTLITALKEG